MSYFYNVLIIIFLTCSLISNAYAVGSGGGSGAAGEACPKAKELTAKEKEVRRLETLQREPLVEEMARKLSDALDAENAELAIVGRLGGDLGDRKFRKGRRNGPKQEMNYTHAGFAIKDSENQKWYFDHLLNLCSGPKSDLFKQSLKAFFRDKASGLKGDKYYRTVIFIPSTELQSEIKAVLASSLRLDFHNPNYNAVSYPFSAISKEPVPKGQQRADYQNSNQWILEITVAALMRLQDSSPASRAELQLFMKNNNYQPTVMPLGFFEKVGAGVLGLGLGRNKAMDDQPGYYRKGSFGIVVETKNNDITWVSVPSINSFLTDMNMSQKEFEICPGKEIGANCQNL